MVVGVCQGAGSKERVNTSQIWATGSLGTIRNLWLALNSSSKIIVGKGDETKFWTDDWCGNEMSRDLFPGLLSICTNLDIGGALELDWWIPCFCELIIDLEEVQEDPQDLGTMWRSVVATKHLDISFVKGARETNKHQFMHCKVTAQVWALLTSIANEY
ncbi:hypothetical protein H5410_046381 [Solanum commersonii]|uniref:Uncharacterized protein n=1 Tax=Solanum commersonii TaxID=4109 RepID=A0A9J5XC40_SOLCO|nr:hypothetical protein H5410_046381 [Solanum commersonii]